MSKPVSREHDHIDLVQLRATSSHVEWNGYLKKCYDSNDVQGLVKTFYGLQSGMDKAVKDKLNDEKLVMFFIRLQRSIEKTLKAIQRKLTPNPLDNPSNIGKYGQGHLDLKRARDQELEAFFRKMRF